MDLICSCKVDLTSHRHEPDDYCKRRIISQFIGHALAYATGSACSLNPFYLVIQLAFNRLERNNIWLCIQDTHKII